MNLYWQIVCYGLVINRVPLKWMNTLFYAILIGKPFTGNYCYYCSSK